MAVIQKTGGRVDGKPVKPVATKKQTPAMESLTLPSEVSSPSEDLGDYTTLIYGEKKIGKTSLAAQFPDALFLMFEPGGKGLRIFQREIRTWKDFTGYLKLLGETDRFKTIVIDTIDLAYERCFQHVCWIEGFTHPQDEAFGKGWKAIETEFRTQLTKLLQSGRGVVFLSHADEREFQERTGSKYNKIIPSMPKQARTFIAGVVDIIAYYGYYGKDRLMTIQGSDTVDAGHRIGEAFRTTTGEHVHSIPMGRSPEEAYANLIKAFGNQQTDSGEPDVTTGLSETPAKFESKRR